MGFGSGWWWVELDIESTLTIISLKTDVRANIELNSYFDHGLYFISNTVCECRLILLPWAEISFRIQCVTLDLNIISQNIENEFSPGTGCGWMICAIDARSWTNLGGNHLRQHFHRLPFHKLRSSILSPVMIVDSLVVFQPTPDFPSFPVALVVENIQASLTTPSSRTASSRLMCSGSREETAQGSTALWSGSPLSTRSASSIGIRSSYHVFVVNENVDHNTPCRICRQI